MTFILHFRRALIRFLALLALAASMSITTGCDDADSVEMVEVERGPIVESFMEKATTSLEKTWVVSMPLTGRIGRIELEVGDRIRKGEQVASYDLVPMQKSLDEAQAAVGEAQAKIAVNEDDTLENTALTEIEQILRSIEESVKAAEAQVKAARTIMEWAEKKYERFLELHQKGAISQDELDDAKLEYDTAVLGLREQEFTLSALKAFHAAAKIGPSFIRRHIDKKDLKKKGLQHALEGARARLAKLKHQLELAVLEAPVSGVVLRKFTSGDGYFRAGTQLIEIGILADMEVSCDVLTTDALLLSKGTPVKLTAAQRFAVTGKVTRVEPQGYTKLSSLGVEQQRVKVVISLDEVPEKLGAGFRLTARFITDKKDGVLLVPRYSVMESCDGRRYVLVRQNEVYAKRYVETGLSNETHFEIRDGLSEGEEIVATPSAKMAEEAKED